MVATHAADRANIHVTVGRSARNAHFADGPPGLLILTLKGDTLAAPSVPPEWRFSRMTGFRIRILSLMGTLVAIAAVVGNSKSF